MSGTSVGFVLARADHRFRACNYVKVAAKKIDEMPRLAGP